MRVSRRVRRLAGLALGFLGARALLTRRKRRPAGPSAPPGESAAWPPEVRSFVRSLQGRGATLREVRREGIADRRAWVVEWDEGRTFAFPDDPRGDPW